MLHNLVCVRGKETFGLTLWAKDTKEALERARKMTRESGYAVHPAPQATPAPQAKPVEVLPEPLPLAA